MGAFVIRICAPAYCDGADCRLRSAIKPSRRFLVVDDHHGCAVSLARLLRSDGHSTIIAHDGAEALEAAEKHRPEVVILDIDMPVLNGYGVCQRLRERPYGKDTLIIALTGLGRDSDRRKSLGGIRCALREAREL